MGDANASIPTPQPILPRPMYGAIGRAPAANSVSFVAPLAVEDGLPERLSLGKRFVAIESTRAVTKADMRENDARPRARGDPESLAVDIAGPGVRVDPDSFAVHIDGELVEAVPAAELPMAQRYFLF